MFVEILSSNLDLLRLKKELEEVSMSTKVLIVDESFYERFESAKHLYGDYRWIFFGSKSFIYSTILKESFQKNLWAVITENQASPESWSVLKSKLLGSSSEDEKILKKIEINKHPPQKEEALLEMEKFLESFSLPQRVQTHLLSITDELLMNALYDAPYSETLGFIHNKTPRNMPLKMDHPVFLDLIQQGNYLKVQVTDFYGSLNKIRTIYHLTRQFDRKKYEVDNSKAGAGLGLAQSFSKGACLSFDCDPKKKTTVSATFKIVGSYLQHLQEHKFVVFNFQEEKTQIVKKGA